MITTGTLDGNVEAINMLRASESVEDLVAAGTLWAKATGFDHWAYGIGAPATPRLIGTFPESWTDAESASSNFCGPLYERSLGPVTWDLHSQMGDPLGVTPTRHRLLHESCKNGLRSGITVPISSPDGRPICVFTASNTCRVDPGTRRRQEPFTVAFSIYFQQAVARVLGEQIFAPQHPLLVPRELECLQWSAKAKTSADIAVILGIKLSTVNLHIYNAARKLGVKGRLKAIQQASKLHLLES